MILGIEAGATRTRAVWLQGDRTILAQQTLAGLNLHLAGTTELESLLRSAAAQGPGPDAVGVGIAGARSAQDRHRIAAAIQRVWPGLPAWAGNDLETALAAAPPGWKGAEVLVLSGTGSCCFGRDPTGGSTTQVGGWGHVLGDRGSGFAIARAALRETLRRWEHTGRWPPLGARLLRALAMNSPEEWIDWSLQASKPEVAALAKEVFAAAHEGDGLARQLVREAMTELAEDALVCARRIARPPRPVRFVLAGGCLLSSPGGNRWLARRLRAGRPDSRVVRLETEGAVGAARLARALCTQGPSRTGASRATESGVSEPPLPDWMPEALGLSPTEERHPASIDLDRLPLRQAIRLMIAEQEAVTAALETQVPAIEKAVRRTVRALRQGGRLFYVGAGTSGRLGVLDASECPPTFRASPDQVQGIIAGGPRALWAAVEGAEDDWVAGMEAVRCRGVKPADVVVGIAASGRTPFVWGAIEAARAVGATTMLLSFNPRIRFRRGRRPDVWICPETGPEVLTGSTRLKAGTATKLVLNMISTLAMVRLGKVAGNLMIDLDPTNRKLRARAVRLVRELTGTTESEAAAALREAGWVVRRALETLGWRRGGPQR